MSDRKAPGAAVELLRFPPTAFPKGKPIQKNLDTHYVNLEALFRSLAQESFVGTVLMVFEEGTEALIVFREGTIITAYTFGTERHIGIGALSQALSLAKSSRAYVDVFKLEHEMLFAMLPLLHVSNSQELAGETPEGVLGKCRDSDFVGALVAGGQVPEAFCLIYGGMPVGWYDAQGGELEDMDKPPELRSSGLWIFALENAEAFAAINLRQAKLQVSDQLRDILFGELKELGMVLYARSLAGRRIADESLASKSEFVRLVEDVERDLIALRGPAQTASVVSRLNGAVDTLMDVGF